jgi:hypothetical protein
MTPNIYIHDCRSGHQWAGQHFMIAAPQLNCTAKSISCFKQDTIRRVVFFFTEKYIFLKKVNFRKLNSRKLNYFFMFDSVIKNKLKNIF